ncbi:MAG: hypothetical protein IJO10_06815, partial [Clostridia bacterium]|nr:hypothetical protein [Clostridia bacterium]
VLCNHSGRLPAAPGCDEGNVTTAPEPGLYCMITAKIGSCRALSADMTSTVSPTVEVPVLSVFCRKIMKINL